MFVTVLNVPVLVLASIFSIFDLLPFLSPEPTPPPAAVPALTVVEPTAMPTVEPTETPVVEPTATTPVVWIVQTPEPSPTARPAPPTPRPATPSPTATPRPATPSPTATPRLFPTNREVGILRPASTPTPVPYTGQKLSPAVPSRIARWEPEIRAAAELHKLDPNLIAALMTTESNGDAGAVSGAGAIGLLQVVDGPYDPAQNVLVGTKMLVTNLRLFDDDLELALAAYNSGPRNVVRYKGVPPFDETRAHIQRTLAAYERFRAASQGTRAQPANNAS